MKKVLVAAPICEWYEYCFPEFARALRSLTYPRKDIFFVDNSPGMRFYQRVLTSGFSVEKSEHLHRIRDMVTRDHNRIRQKVLDEDYDYLLILDQDVIPPPDVIEKLMAHDKDVVSGMYFGHHDIGNGEVKVMPFAWAFSKEHKDWNNTGYLLDSEMWADHLLTIAFAGMGCILFKRKVLEKIEFRYSLEMDAWDDRWLGVDVWDKGFEFYLDTSVKCKHLYKDRPFSYWELKKQGRN
ncbi:glycosyltransferase family 2 protein [Candidatus Woesearchaeota archaeon]|nr:glycosyltransferase family 2 protein [Candidatus Woesearchaeota archaeon]